MKKTILAFTAFIITLGAYAQTDSSGKKMTPPDINNTNDSINQNRDMNNYQNQNIQNNPVDKSQPDGVMMQNRKMMMVKDGKMTILDHDMTMSNGITVMSNGSYMKKGGAKMMFKEGEHMDMSGSLTPMKNSNPKIK